MITGRTVMRGLTLVAAASAIVWQHAAFAQGVALHKPISHVTMVCHESGGSGAPLTDYVNNLDVSWVAGDKLETTLPGDIPVIYTETNPGHNGLPTPCSVAASYLSELGFVLTQSFSHFPGYYIEIFTD
jgi:hypothetical protein